ncbi:MAG TPA: SDR family oxidoreductase [Kofleriaceae bacterium]
MLDGKKVVVIGGGSGIGAATAALATSEGASVEVGSRSTKGRTVDVRDEASVAAFFAAIGPFDHLAITAGDWGGPMRAGTADIDLAASRSLFDVRFWGVIAAVKHATKTIAATGSITLTSGMLVHRPMKGMPLAAALGAVEHLARGFAVDLAPVRVNAVCPGLVLTEVVKAQWPEQYRNAAVAPLPIPRVATPEEAAKAYVYLMSNGYVTGQILPVDGGGMLI